MAMYTPLPSSTYCDTVQPAPHPMSSTRPRHGTPQWPPEICDPHNVVPTLLQVERGGRRRNRHLWRGLWPHAGGQATQRKVRGRACRVADPTVVSLDYLVTTFPTPMVKDRCSVGIFKLGEHGLLPGSRLLTAQTQKRRLQSKGPNSLRSFCE